MRKKNTYQLGAILRSPSRAEADLTKQSCILFLVKEGMIDSDDNQQLSLNDVESKSACKTGASHVRKPVAHADAGPVWPIGRYGARQLSNTTRASFVNIAWYGPGAFPTESELAALGSRQQLTLTTLMFSAQVSFLIFVRRRLISSPTQR